uniref:Uncharacterized protein n=1 Tax=Arundo donax TaxID=35708 RepID=A0A0A9BH93_ARUDO
MMSNFEPEICTALSREHDMWHSLCRFR